MAEYDPFVVPYLDVALLPVVEALARARSFAGAARRLGVVPATVHAHMKQLESALHTQLYRRVGRGIELTPAGNELAAFARRVVEDAARVARDVRRRPHREGVRLVADSFACLHLLGAALRRFVEGEHGPLHLRTCDAEAAIAAVRAEKAEIAVVPELGVDASGLEGLRFARVPTVVLVRRGHRLLDKHEVNLRDLAGETVLVPSARASLLERARVDVAASSPRAIELESAELVVALVGAGVGIGVVEGAVRAPDALRARPLVDVPETTYRFAHTRLTRLSSTAWALREAIVAEAASWKRARDVACSAGFERR